MMPIWRKKDREELEKTAFILKNGEILLEQLITTFDGKRNHIGNFSSEELKLATNNYDIMNIIKIDDTFYKLYKGSLLDRQISVMKFENISYEYNYSIKNIVFASQMCHKHIFKLIGCCLETIVPILVFEPLVKYGTLKDHICRHHESHLESLSWKQRLKISVEIANAFAYLHVGFPRPIVYSLMSSSQFLLDEHCVPKLFDFSHAECIPKGETQIKDTVIRGHWGYLAPEHFLENVLDERCDVFGFGSLLLELLTGQIIEEFFDSFATKYGDRYEEIEDERCDWFRNILMKKINENNGFVDIVDPIIVGDGLSPEIEQKLKVFAELSIKCLSYSGEDRPTMIDVAKQLRQLHLSAT